MADGVRTLPPMARGRPLAADSGIAPALPMMQTAHSRDRNGTVGLGKCALMGRGKGKMARNVRGACVSVLYCERHPGSPNTGVLVVDYQHLGE